MLVVALSTFSLLDRRSLQRELASELDQNATLQTKLATTVIERDTYRMDAIKANWLAAQLQILHDRTKRELARSNSEVTNSAQGESPTRGDSEAEFAP